LEKERESVGIECRDVLPNVECALKGKILVPALSPDAVTDDRRMRAVMAARDRGDMGCIMGVGKGRYDIADGELALRPGPMRRLRRRTEPPHPGLADRGEPVLVALEPQPVGNARSREFGVVGSPCDRFLMPVPRRIDIAAGGERSR